MSMIKLTYNFTFKDYRNEEEIKNVSSILLPLLKYAFQLNRKTYWPDYLSKSYLSMKFN